MSAFDLNLGFRQELFSDRRLRQMPLKQTSVNEIKCITEMIVRNAARTLKPAGPPPTQTTSYISGEDAVA